MDKVVEVFLAVILVLSFVPVFIALESDQEISSMIFELLISIFR